VSATATPVSRAVRVRLRQLAEEERQLAFVWGVLAASSLLLRPFWIAVAPLMPPCPFRALTGLPCLSCGTTRAAVALLEGHPLEALSVNPLAAAAGIAFLAGGAVAPLWAVLRLPLPRLGIAQARWFRVALAVTLLAAWAWVIAVQR